MDERELNYVNAASDGAPQKNEKPRLNVANLLVGLLVVALAAFGVYRLVQLGVGYFKDRSRDLETIEAGAYYAYLIPPPPSISTRSTTSPPPIWRSLWK